MTSCDILKKRKGLAYRILCGFLAFTFFFSWVLPPGYAQLLPQTILNLPVPGTMVAPSAAFTPALINGITIHPENPLEFDFIVGTGDDKLQGKAFEEESTKLIKYFLASLTVPEDEMWVNLSPYEKDRIIPEGFGTTGMGRDLLAQDYILKQLTASLMYPEKELGSEFWKKIYQKAREQYGTTEIPVNTFNKVWIVPEKAVVYEHGNSAFVVKARLKVMLEEDYLGMNFNVGAPLVGARDKAGTSPAPTENNISQIIKEIILPEIEKEVNEGKGFANLRQIYHSAILAAWFKQNLRQTLLGQVYVDKAKTKGVDVEDKTVNQKIYAQYLEAFKKGVYNYIKEDYDPATQEMIPRKYFSGGANLTSLKTKDVLETYEQPLTSLQRKIVDALLASPQQEVNITLLELSQKRSAADIQKAVASSRQAAKKSSSPVLPPSVKRLLVHSEYLIGEMNDALAAGDTARLKARLEEARVPLPGSENGRPYLFAIGAQTTPEERDVSGMSVGEIQGRLSDYIEISEDEARKLKERDPFSFRTKELSEKNGRIYEAALKAGLLGVRYIATNIKKFSENSHLAYIEFLKRTVAEYNGYVVVLLSVEESPDVLQGDGAGMATLAHAIEAKLGKEFLRSAQIDIITDGGLKTRGGNWTGKYGYNGVMPTPYGIVYYRRAMTTLGKVRLQHRDFGRNRIYWTASDGDYDIGDLTYGRHKEADLQDDGSWSMIIHGKEEELLDEEDMDDAFRKLGDILQRTEGARSGLDEKAQNALLEREFAKDPQMAKILASIKEKKLEDLGQNFSDPGTGRLVKFKEKGKSNVILEMLREIHTNKIIPNAFLVVYTQEAFLKQLEHYKKLTSEGKRLAEYGGSYFQAVVQSKFDALALGSLPAATQEMFKDLAGTVFPRHLIIAASLGETGRFRDRGNTDLLSRAYSERIEDIRGQHLEELVDRGMMLDKNVTIQLEEGDVAILENVKITADRPVKLTLKDGVFIQNSRLHLGGDTILPERTIIIDSNLEGKLDIHGGNTVILGVVFKKEQPLLDINANGRWNAVENLEVYPEETMVSILTTDGTRYINRTLTDAPYRGGTLLQIANGDMAGLAAKHPRLAGVQGVSEPNVDLLTMRNWRNLEGQNVDIAKAKEAMDYVKTYEEMNGGRSSSPIDGKMAMTEVPDSEWEGRTVVIRPDFNVPLDEQGKIADDSRIQASLETIRYVLERGAKVVIISHLGDPWGEIRKREVKYRQGGLSREAAAGRAGEEIFKKMSLSVVAQRLQELLPGVKVHFRARYNWTMSDTSEFIQGKMKPGEVFLLENVRFNPGEKEKKDIYFAGDLMKGADIIVSDGLSVAHRNDVSMTGRPGKDVPRVAGLAFVREVRALKDVRDNARTIVMGGSKVSGKIGVIRTFLDNPNVGKIMVGGGMANAFFVAKGFSIGATVVGTEPADVDIARTLLENSQVVIPSDAVAVDNFDIPTRSKVINFDNGEAVPDGWVIVDIGPATIAAYQEIIARDGLTFWNGPMGAFDVKSVAQFARKGTNGVGEAVADARGVVGGGDTVNAVKLFGLTGYSYISTAGGAALEFLEGEELPGIAALSDKTVPPAGRPEVLPSLDDEDFVPKIEITDFLKPGVGVADALGRYWQAGGRGPVFLQEIVDGTKLKKEFVLSAINGINGSFNSRFSVEPAGLNKRLDGQTQWVQLVPRRSMGESRPLSQGLQPHASSPVEGLEVALVGGRDSDVVRNMRLIGQLLAANESSRILVGGVTALVLMEAKNWIDRADYNYKPEPVEKEINGKKKMVDVRPGILDDARSYMNHSRVILPSQVEVMDPKDPENREVILVGRGEKVPPGKVIVGFGEQTIRAYAGTISGSRSTFWNGPMDVNGTPQEISEALAQAQRRGPLFVGEASVDAAKAADLTGFVPFFRDDLSKFLDDKAMNGRRGVTISRDKDLGNGSRVRGEENLGGINLDPGLFDLQIKRDGNGVPLPLPQQPISEMHIEGFIPVIINITPVTDLPMLLGVAEDGLPKDSADTGSPATPMILGLARED